MADNTTLNTGSGGDVIASDDITGVKHQRVKVQYGGDGSATDVDSTNRLPVTGAELTAIQTAVEILDNIVAGSEAQCDVVTQPARVHTTDRISAAIDSSVVMDGLTAMTPAFAVVDDALSGDNTIVAAQGAGAGIRVVAAFLIAAGTVTVRFESGAAGTALTGQMNLVANTGFVLPYNPAGWFQTADNALLNLELSAAISVDGCITYVVT